MRLRSIAALAVTILISTSPAVAAHAAEPSGAPAKRAAVSRLTARTANPLAVYAQRGDDAPVTTLTPTTEFGTTRVVLVVRRRGAWLKVRLPERPNGATGWVRARDVELRSVTDAVVVDLTSRTLTWRRGGRRVLETTIAIGAPDTSTPTGHFYVTDLLDTPDGGAYGPYAIGLAAHSDTLSEFGGGDGQIGLHGTNDPSSIGQSVSHGCVRVPNDVIVQLATSMPLGTPVTIR